MEYNKFQQHALDRIEFHQERLAVADNNLRYIKALKSIHFWLDRFCNLLTPEERLLSAEYMAMFHTGCGWTMYDRIGMSIEAYNYGERPF